MTLKIITRPFMDCKALAVCKCPQYANNGQQRASRQDGTIFFGGVSWFQRVAQAMVPICSLDEAQALGDTPKRRRADTCACLAYSRQCRWGANATHRVAAQWSPSVRSTRGFPLH